MRAFLACLYASTAIGAIVVTQASESHFKVLLQSYFNIHVSTSTGKNISLFVKNNHIIGQPFITKHYYQVSGAGVGIRGQKLGQTYFKVLLQSF